MEQLSGLDALFVHAEMHGLPMHISTLSIYDPSTSPSGVVQFSDIINLFESRIKNQIPILRSRLVQVPFNFDQPYWEEDPNFDMVYHVRHIALPKPGNWHKLCSLVANLHAQPLNRKRPLWEAYIIDGLETVKGFPMGSFAVMLKVHHSVMDGRTGMAIFNSLHSIHPDPKLAVDGFNFDDYPTLELTHNLTTSQIVRRAYINNIKRTGNLIRIIAKSAATYADVKLAFRNNDVKSLHKPKTRFNGPISPRRIVDRINLPIEGINTIKSVFKGETLNDVALTIIGGALRRYLLNKEELPESSLVAGVPIDVRRDEDRDVKGNLINVMNISLRTDISNPIERLSLLHNESKSGKTFAHLLGDHSIHELLDNLYAGLISWGVRTAVDSGLMEKFPPANNTIVSTVPGTRTPVYLAGAKLLESFGMGPLIPNTGLFHSVGTTYDHMTIAFTACRHMMDDPDYYVSCLRESYEELLLAASETLPSIAKAGSPLHSSLHIHASNHLEH
jgi:diacylglycerol O-acyltransferase / wax synthase